MTDPRIKHAANWLARFTVNGVPPSDFHDVLASIERWEDWCRAWSARAKVHETLGHEALAERHFVSAGEHLGRAAALYHFAKYLFVNDMKEMRAAHRRAVACLTLACPISTRLASGSPYPMKASTSRPPCDAPTGSRGHRWC